MHVRLMKIVAVPLLLLLAVPVMAAGNPNAPTVSTVSYMDRLDQVEAQLVSLKMQGCGGCGDCGTSCGSCGSCSPCGASVVPRGPYIGVSAAVVRPYLPQPLVYLQEPATGWQTCASVPFELDSDVSPRFWMGYVGCDGLGARIRYWQFDQTGDVSFAVQDAGIVANVGPYWEDWDLRDGDVAINFGIELHAVDLEVTQDFRFRSAVGVLSGGVRYARVVQDYDAICTRLVGSMEDIQLEHVFEGCGPTVALELHRPVGCRGLALFGSFRGSALFGDVDAIVKDLEYEQPNGPLLDNDDVFTCSGENVAGVLEAQVGVEWTRRLSRGADLLVRLGYEGQVWYGVGSPTNPQGGPPLGFEGLIVDLGVSR
jgi:hypothetical protein